jgi:sec-independent protein translocase protein TatB
MEILGIGPSELVFIIIIALIVLGPKDMQKAGRTIGRWLNNLVRSDSWKAFQQTSKEIRSLPTKLMREANMEIAETEREMRKAMDTSSKLPPSPLGQSPSTKSNEDPTQTQESENTIQPPSTQPIQADTDSNEKNS